MNNDNSPPTKIPASNDTTPAQDKMISPISPDLQSIAPDAQDTVDAYEPKFDVSSIYPTPTTGSLALSGQQTVAAGPSAKQIAPQSEQTSMELIKVVIFILGAWIALSSLVSLIEELIPLFHSTGASRTLSPLSYVSIGLGIVSLLVGIGILRRKELARVFYVFISILGIALTAFGIYTYLHVSSANTSVSSSYSARIASDQQRINKYNSDTSIPAQIRQEYVNSAEQDIANTKAFYQSQAPKPTTYTWYIVLDVLSILFTLGTVVFLMSSSVKKLFS